MISAKDKHAVPGVTMQRNLLLISHPAFEHPLIIDIFKIISQKKHQYDLPYYYKGHLINTDYKYNAFDTTRTLLGSRNGIPTFMDRSTRKPQARDNFYHLVKR